MRTSTTTTWLLFGLAGVFLAFIVLAASAFTERQTSGIDEAARLGLPQATERAAAELATLERGLISLQLNDGRTSIEDIRATLMRIRTSVGELQALRPAISANIDNDLPALIDDFAVMIERLQPLVERAEDMLVIDAARSHIESAARLTAALRQHGTSYGVEHFRQLRDTISWQFRSFIVLVGVLVITVSALLFLSWRQIRLLRLSNRHAVSLGHHLRDVRDELETASKALEASNAELAAQNRLLKESETTLARQNYRFSAAIENMQEGLSMLDGDLRLLISNSRFGEMYDLPPSVCAPGTHIKTIHAAMIERGFMTQPQSDAILMRRAARDARTGPSTFTLGTERGVFYEVHEQPLADGGWVTTAEDITERHLIQARTSHLALHDGLTGLRNRSAFYEDLSRSIGAIEDGRTEIAVVLFDLNRFKRVNDLFGHAGGDHLLEEIARQVIRIVRPEDTLARLGGDEFGILICGSGARVTAENLAAQLVEIARDPFLIAEGSADVGISVGVACAPQHARDTRDLMRCADTALYTVKNERLSGWRMFDAAMDAGSLDRRMIEAELSLAIAEDDFQLHYQPIIEIATGRIIGGEALLRWTSPTRGMVSPATVIAIAEESGLILPLGERILAKAITAAATWPEALMVAINLSPKQVKSTGLARTIMETLVTHGVAGRRVELELTETVLAEDDVADLMHELRACVIRFALDDFGTGYASLSYLTRFPFDRIKIDKSFVREAATRPECRAIIQTVCDLGRRLGLDTLAEGIETSEELNIVSAASCAFGQGYYFGRPLPEADFLTLAEAQAARIEDVDVAFAPNKTSAA